MAIWRQITRRLNQPSDQRRFRHRNIFQVLVEVRPRSLSKTADCERAALSQINPVGVKLKDLLLGEFLLHLHRDQHFGQFPLRSEEHTSELQSLAYLVCRLLLE